MNKKRRKLDLAGTAWDVVVVGSGPAGCATAITLARFGQRVLLVEKRASASVKLHVPLGESLHPASVGLAEHFLANPGNPTGQLAGSFRTAGNASLSAGGQLDIADFSFTSAGHGLCVDRLAFDEALRMNAVAAGATLHRGVDFLSCARVTDGSLNWRMTFKTPGGILQACARYLVDCSGRQAVVARALETPALRNEDRLFACAQWFSCTGGDDDRYTRVEAAPDGWWYSNRLPATARRGSSRVVVFHSDEDLPAGRQAATPSGFDRLLQGSRHIGPLLSVKGYRPCGVIRGAPAHSQRLQDFCGDAWMAVGDAAQAHDPLSSQGMAKALRTASHAGHMIHYALTAWLAGTKTLGLGNTFIAEYDEQQRQLWAEYESQRGFYYHAQPHWSDHPFWQRRRQRFRQDEGEGEAPATAVTLEKMQT
ncbi:MULTISPECIES: NAD(P)/FAD-dependent oxidoreductase [unclassified Achromobacter]|uniref:NAD(P)/FAD-dependent oxidoreductase n=1 Tax=unclassified Achromobacter TaxID=2626865 RepID=UPI000B514CFD|nr:MULTISPECIES: NAD(P)/FAD-dependent oxidoreductase [unclassified Achromobacter]OWT80636.1 FAD-binding monooxygenase [Achromobacter sp. HZ34]OWT82518.1 FAD-binding monooxygenase [Achromobacter sp. HZ28]